MDSIIDWEVRFHGHHSDRAEASTPQAPTLSQPPQYTSESIERYMKWRFPERKGLAVRTAKVLPGGFSKTTVLIDIVDELEGERSLVIRAEQPPRFDFWEGDQVKNEFVVLQLMHEAGLPVAEPLWWSRMRHCSDNPFSFPGKRGEATPARLSEPQERSPRRC